MTTEVFGADEGFQDLRRSRLKGILTPKWHMLGVACLDPPQRLPLHFLLTFVPHPHPMSGIFGVNDIPAPRVGAGVGGCDDTQAALCRQGSLRNQAEIRAWAVCAAPSRERFKAPHPGPEDPAPSRGLAARDPTGAGGGRGGATCRKSPRRTQQAVVAPCHPWAGCPQLSAFTANLCVF